MMEDRIRRACAWIENHIDEDIPADAPARIACVSDYHFRRHFTALTGISPGKYIRRRRLSRTVQQLLETSRSVLDIGLDAGFQSHEAFTRAFTEMLGRSPRAFRHDPGLYAHLLQPALDTAMLDHLFNSRTTLQPAIRTFEGARVAGPGTDYAFGTDPLELNQLWQAFIPRQYEIEPGDQASPAYGITRIAPGRDAGMLRYNAALPIADNQVVPEDMETIDLPAGTYAVFTHNGALQDFPRTIAHIWGTALPKSGTMPDCDIDFELYDERFDPVALSGVIEVWIPIERA